MAKTGDRLKRLLFGQEDPPLRVNMTIAITGIAEENLYKAELVFDDNSGTLVPIHFLHKHIQKLITGALGG